MPRISASTRTKLGMVAVAVVLFAVLGGLVNRALGHSLFFGFASAVLMGMAISTFEIFYVQGQRGRWLRVRSATLSFFIYLVVVVLVSILSRFAARLVFGSPAELWRVYERLPATVLYCIAISGICILVMRVLRHIGVGTLTDLAFGTYRRPVLRRKILMFVDMNGSTMLAEKLGAFRTQTLVEKFTLDLSRPVVDFGGTIHLYKGDGFVAVWNWATANDIRSALAAVDGMFAALAREAPQYHASFRAVPTFRVGIHGGDVVLSETGDLKRAIGIYGDVINVASRIEEASRAYRVPCIVSDVVVNNLADMRDRFHLIGTEKFRGVQAPMDIYAFHVHGTEIPPPPVLRRIA